MGKRVVLAGAFLVVAVGLSWADGEPPGQQQVNQISCDIGGVGNPPAAGQVEAVGKFSGFAYACISSAKVELFEVKIHPTTGVRTEIALNSSHTKLYSPLATEDKTGVSHKNPGLGSGRVVCAKFNLYGSGLPAGIKDFKQSKDFTIP